MGLFDGLGSHDNPERRQAVKREQAALLQGQIAEKQRMRGQGDGLDLGSRRGQGDISDRPGAGRRQEPGQSSPWQAARQEAAAGMQARPAQAMGGGQAAGMQAHPVQGMGGVLSPMGLQSQWDGRLQQWSPAMPTAAQVGNYGWQPPATKPLPAAARPPPAISSPWQVAPLQAWRSPPAASKPISYFPRPQMQPLPQMHAGWQAPQMRSQVDEVVYGHDMDFSSQQAHGARNAASNIGYGAGRGVARPQVSEKGGWLPPQLRSQADEIIYGHDLDGYDGAPQMRPGRAPPPPQPEPPASGRRRPTSQSGGLSNAQIDIDAEWKDWESQHPEFRRKRRVEPGENSRASANDAPPTTSARNAHKNNNNPVVDIDAEWAEWESKNPQFKKRHKRAEASDSATGSSSAPAGGSKSPTQASHATTPFASPLAVAARPPISPPRAPATPNISNFTVQPPAPDAFRSGNKSRISEDLRGINSFSLSDDLRVIRRSCSDQRALLHSQNEKLRAEVSRLLMEEANGPSTQHLAQQPLRAAGSLDSPHPISSTPLSRMLEEQRRLVAATPSAASSALQLQRSALPRHGAGKDPAFTFGGNASNVTVPPELALAELRLAAVEAINRKRAVLPALPDYPVVLKASDPPTHTWEGTLAEASTFVFPDVFPPALTSPANSGQPQPLALQLEVGTLESLLAYAPAGTEIAAAQAAASRAKAEDSVSDGRQPLSGRSGGSEKSLLTLDLNRMVHRNPLVSESSLKSIDMDSLAYSRTASDFGGAPNSARRSAPDAPPPQGTPFSRVIDLGAALRNASNLSEDAASGEPATSEAAVSETTNRPGSDEGAGSLRSEATALPAASGSDASPDTTSRAPASALEGALDVAGQAVAVSPAAEMATQGEPTASESARTPSKSVPVSPRRLLPRPENSPDAAAQLKRDKTDDSESSGGVRRTQDFLMDVLIPEMQPLPTVAGDAHVGAAAFSPSPALSQQSAKDASDDVAYGESLALAM